MFNLGWQELLIILLILVLIFGAKKLPELMRSVGRSAGEFKKGVEEGQSESDKNKSTTKGNEK
ncbi:twin-arginine translocase TatA/TatE family subunit [Candidatus Saccharibacteria bacterium CPR2]|nr:twin-arginine translocase TatA/TatE family subunit [Candidatus Saccharibacteria bacterium CPR2]